MRRSLLTPATVILLFLAAFVANLRLAGTSPIVWIDTFNDEHEVQQCLIDDSCTLTGMSTSVPGLAHAVAWLELRTLLAWFGLGLDGAHRAIQVGNALAIVLIFVLASKLGGPIAGVLAGWLAMDRLDAFAPPAALHNVNLLLFLGTLFLLACVAVVARPGVISIALAALVAAVMTNVHLACAMTGASVVWVALVAPRRRLRLALFGALSFGVATVVMAPPTWMHNLNSLLADRTARGHTVVLDVPANPLTSWSLFASAAWLASLVIRSPAAADFRRRMQGPLAVIVPSLAVFLVAPRFGFNPEAKYVFHLKAACALAAALPIGAVADSLLRTRCPQAAAPWRTSVAALLLAAALALPGPFAIRAHVTAADERTPTVNDLGALVHVLRDEQGWDAVQIIARTRTPFGMPLVIGLQQRLGASREMQGAVADPAAVALFVMTDNERLPDPIPPSWRILRRTGQAATVLVSTRSRIDWHSVLICVQSADGGARHCDKSGWKPQAMGEAILAGMPPGGAWRGVLELWLALRPEPAAPETHIAMPRMALGCGGRIVSPSDGTITVANSQRFAVIAEGGSEGPEPHLLKLEWIVGSPQCNVLAYDGSPPFFIEGDPDTVRLLAPLLDEDRNRGAPTSGIDLGAWLSIATAQAETGPTESPALIDRVLDRIDQSLLRRCLTPDAGRAMNDVIATGALKPVLGDHLTLARGDVRGDQIELGFQDRQQRAYTITLALPGAKSGQPDGRGGRFLYYVSASSDLTAAVRRQMLAAAELFDSAIPETALQRCAGGEAPKADPRYPRSIALGSAVLELMIVLAAVGFGLRAVRTSA